MIINKISDSITEVEQGRNNVTTYFLKVNDIEEAERDLINKGFNQLYSDSLNKVLARSSMVQHGTFTDEYSVYTDIINLSLK